MSIEGELVRMQEIIDNQYEVLSSAKALYDVGDFQKMSAKLNLLGSKAQSVSAFANVVLIRIQKLASYRSPAA